MSIPWTDEFDQALAKANDAPARIATDAGSFVLLAKDDFDWVRGMVRDLPEAEWIEQPHTRRIYALVPMQTYERIKPLFEEDPPGLEERRAALRAAGLRAGWNDPIWDDLDAESERR